MSLEFISKAFNWGFRNDKMFVEIECPKEKKETVQQFVTSLTDKEYDVTVKHHRDKRTLDQNAHMWKYINELSNVLLISKDECYLNLLKHYGQCSVVSVLNDAVPMFTRAIKYYDIMSESELNGKTFTHIKVYMGSSEMNTKEAWILTQGLLDECQEQGISTESPEELERLKAAWEESKK